MPTARRYLVLLALMFWLGGFTFYASLVVPIGTRILGSARDQGFITREVTRDLNRSAVVALAVLAWETLAARDPSRVRRRARAGLWVVLALCQALLFVLHARLDHLMHVDETVGIDEEVFRAAFRPSHRVYLWTHTVQLFVGLAFVWLMLRGWSAEDLAGRSPAVPPDRA